MAKRKLKRIKRTSKSIYIKKECPAFDSECNMILLDILSRQMAQINSCEKYERDLEKSDALNVKRGFDLPKMLDEFKKKYELFKRMLTEELNDFNFQRLKEKLLILKEDYNEFSKSPLVARNHLIKHLQTAASTAESKLARLKPTQWDLNDNFVQIKFEPLAEVKEEPIVQENVSCQPTTSNSSSLQVNKKRSQLSGHQRLSLNKKIRKSSLKSILKRKSSIQIQQRLFSLLKAKKLIKYRPLKDTIAISQQQLDIKDSLIEVETSFSLKDVALGVEPCPVAEMPHQESSLE
jgi:hypothetical protein